MSEVFPLWQRCESSIEYRRTKIDAARQSIVKGCQRRDRTDRLVDLGRVEKVFHRLALALESLDIFN